MCASYYYYYYFSFFSHYFLQFIIVVFCSFFLHVFYILLFLINSIHKSYTFSCLYAFLCFAIFQFRFLFGIWWWMHWVWRVTVSSTVAYYYLLLPCFVLKFISVFNKSRCRIRFDLCNRNYNDWSAVRLEMHSKIENLILITTMIANIIQMSVLVMSITRIIGTA